MSVLKQLAHHPATKTLLALAITGLSLYLALRNISLAEVSAVLLGADPRFIGIGVLFLISNNSAKALRWRVLLGPPGRAVSFGRVLSAILIGQALNNIYPARVGDLSRCYTLGDVNGGKAYVLGTVALEKIIELQFYAFLFVVLLLLIPLPTWMSRSAAVLALVAVLLTALAFFFAWKLSWLLAQLEGFSTRLPAWAKSRIVPHLQSAASSLQVLTGKKEFLQVFVWSLIVWGTALLLNQVCLLALGLHLPLTAPLLVLIALQAGISLPSVPGRVGLFEYICILALAAFGVNQASALSFGILLHIMAMFLSTLVGVLLFLFSAQGNRRWLIRKI